MLERVPKKKPEMSDPPSVVFDGEKPECPHLEFEAHVAVNRLEDTGQFSADVKIRCKHCRIPMRFLGLPVGVNLEGAAVSFDGTEGRFALVPLV